MAFHKGIFEIELPDGTRGMFDGETWISDSFSEDLLTALNLTSGDHTSLTNFIDVNARNQLQLLGIKNYKVLVNKSEPAEDHPEGSIP